MYRYRSFDYQLENGGKDHRLDLNVQQNWDETAAEQVQGLYERLTPAEQEYCEAFMAGDIESIPDNVLSAIRTKFQEMEK